MVETLEGIVLKTSNYKENSKILQVFSKEHGLVGIFLKGANNYKNKNHQIAQPISHAFFHVNYHEGLSSCFQGEMIASFNKLKIDYNRNLYAFHLFEYILKTLEQHQAFPLLFDLLITTLENMNKTDDVIQVSSYALIFEVKLLYFIGVYPVLDNCVECGRSNNIINFDIQKGGFVCQHCFDSRSKTFSIATLEWLHQFFYHNLDDLSIEKIPPQVTKELRALVSEYYQYHLGVKTNSSQYFS